MSVAGAKRVACATRSLTGGRGLAAQRVTAPADGFVTARLAGPASSDWDLAVVDSKTGNVLNGSAELGSTEIATTAVRKGQKLIIQSCRRKGSARTVTPERAVHEGDARDGREGQARPRQLPHRLRP